MQWALLVLGTVLVVEGFIRLSVPARAGNLLKFVQKIMRTIMADAISDHWKERVLPVYAWRLFRNSTTLFMFICLSIVPMIGIGMASEAFGQPFFGLLASPLGLAGSTLVAVPYVMIRKRLLHV